ncbi:basic salivary proline-rich protein 2-like [Numida meleagris]|uniref:basic salivary proline-rich protein 2-like n=1 Tax=Numida meleagris TaxID=8996 RepID=UPI000B3E1FE9|nr:basic salivary proline-rich protein 2-like [Numida meleagris]
MGGAAASPRAVSAPPPSDSHSLSLPSSRMEKARPTPRRQRGQAQQQPNARNQGTPHGCAPPPGRARVPRCPVGRGAPRGCGTPGPQRTGGAGQAGAQGRRVPEPLWRAKNAAATRACWRGGGRRGGEGREPTRRRYLRSRTESPSQPQRLLGPNNTRWRLRRHATSREGRPRPLPPPRDPDGRRPSPPPAPEGAPPV